MYRVFFSNIGYARGIDGTLLQHVKGFHRNFYTSRYHQEKVLSQVRDVIDCCHPDLCCFVEVDQGSWSSAYLNHLDHITDDDYPYMDAADKYGNASYLNYVPFHKGKSNGFLSKHDIDFRHLYLPYGSKRLIYKLHLPNDIALYFLHFSLNRRTRAKQFSYMNCLIKQEKRPTIVMADFNIFAGFKELETLTRGTDLEIMNDEDHHTFLFYNRELALDLCLCSRGLAQKADLDIIDQPFSDHQALLLTLDI